MTDTQALHVVILAAGQGTRMASDIPKVLHPLAGKPLVGHAIAAAQILAPASITVVIGPAMESIKNAVVPHRTATQAEPKGTGHAVWSGLAALGPKAAGDVLVMLGDVPLITADTLRRLVDAHRASAQTDATILAFEAADPSGYGRVVAGADNAVKQIVEDRDASGDQKKITLCNSGVMVLKLSGLEKNLSSLKPNARSGEYFLTDAVSAMKTVRYITGDEGELQGVNDRAQLAMREKTLQARLRRAAMAAGATLTDPDTVYLSADTVLGRDVVVGPNVFFGPGVVLADRVQVRAFCHIEGVRIETGAVVGPFARIRAGSHIGEGAHIGNFVEIKNTSIGANTKANHLSYLGDSDIGDACNIGAGSITCNYDGFAKYRTAIGSGVFIGSNGTLVAPLTLADGAYIAAGSVITDDVPQDSLSIGRARQVTKHGWASRFRKRKE